MDSGLYAELVVLYARLNRFDTAIRVFVFHLKDDTGAALYCVEKVINIRLSDLRKYHLDHANGYTYAFLQILAAEKAMQQARALTYIPPLPPSPTSPSNPMSSHSPASVVNDSEEAKEKRDNEDQEKKIHTNMEGCADRLKQVQHMFIHLIQVYLSEEYAVST